VSGLEDILAFEERLRDEILPAMRERAHAVDVRAAIDRHLLETEQHVANLRRVGPIELPEDGDIALLAEILRIEHAELAAYAFLVEAARALDLDEESIRLLRLNMEQDDYAREQAEHTLAKLLAERVTARR
jgi:ferritin-like metal-binding protein YciE